MKKFNIITLTVLASLLITAFLLFLNDIIISVRLNELKINLQDMDRDEKSLDHIGLIATYQIHKNIYERKLTQEKADAIEEKIISLILSEKKNNPIVDSAKYKIIATPALWLININRKIIGKAPVIYYRNQDQNSDLDIAYYYERNFLFNHAIAQYDKILEKKNINRALKASLLLHQGYCYALAGLNDKAMNNYSTIINKYGQENSAITATILSRYLEGFRLARERVLNDSTDPLITSQNLVNLLAYEQALGILTEAERTAKPDDILRIKYYIARCYTGLGKPQKAIENYLQIILSSPSSQYAKYSNRKIFIIGSRAGGENNIISISKQLNNKLKDPILSQMIQNQMNVPEPADNIKELNKVNILKNLTGKINSIIKNTENTEKAAKSIYMIIVTSDGNTFKGNLIEQNEKEITLQTSIGRINVKKDKITSVTSK